MPRYIVKLEGRYFEWSTVVDAPVTEPMTPEEFRDYWRDEYGRTGMLRLPEHMARVEEWGTSCGGLALSAEECLRFNRAGPNETCLSMDELRAWARGDS